MSRKVAASSGQQGASGSFIAQPPLMTTAGGVVAPAFFHRYGRTTWPPLEPTIRQSLLSTKPCANSSPAKLSRFGAGLPLSNASGYRSYSARGRPRISDLKRELQPSSE
jgi:hypothetical protein